MKKSTIALIVGGAVLLALVIAGLILRSRYEKEEVPPPFTDIESRPVEGSDEVQEVTDIDAYLALYEFTVVDTPINETLLSLVEHEELKPFYQAIFERNEVPIQEFKDQHSTLVFEEEKVKGTEKEEQLKNLSIFHKKKPESQKGADDGYFLYGALWSHDGNNYGYAVPPVNELKEIAKPTKIYVVMEDESFASTTYFVYDNTILSYFGMSNLKGTPETLTAVLTTSLAASDVIPTVIKHIFDQGHLIGEDLLSRAER